MRSRLSHFTRGVSQSEKTRRRGSPSRLQTRVLPPSHAAPSRGQRCGRRRLHLARVDTCAAQGGLREARVRSLPLRDQRLARQAERQAGCCVAAHGLLHRPSIERGGQPELPWQTATPGWRRARQFQEAFTRSFTPKLLRSSGRFRPSRPRGARLSSWVAARVQHRVSCAVAAPSAAIPTEPPACSPLKPADVVPADVVPCAAVLNRRVSRVLCTRAGVSVGHAGLRAISLERGLGLRGMRGGS